MKRRTRFGWESCLCGVLWILSACATGGSDTPSPDGGETAVVDSGIEGASSSGDSASHPDGTSDDSSDSSDSGDSGDSSIGSGDSTTADAGLPPGDDSGGDVVTSEDSAAGDGPSGNDGTTGIPDEGPPDGAPEAAVEAGDTTPPTAPTGLKSTAITDASISISWTASTDDVGVTGYTIFRNGTQVGMSVATSYTDTGLTPSTMYSYTVSAFDAAGNDSAPSVALPVSTTAVPDTMAPTVPTGLASAGASDKSVSLTWTASTDNVGVTGYKVYRSGTQIGTSPTASFTDSGLTASTMYSYTVSAFDAAGNDSAQSTALPVSTTAAPDTVAPSVPTGLKTTSLTSTVVMLAWTASTDNVGVTGYKVYRAGAQIGTSPTASFTDSGLTANTMYSYTVSAYDAAMNNSAQSAALVVTTPTPPDTTAPSVPTGLTKTAGTATSLSLSWTASTDNVGVTGYKIYRGGNQVGTSATTSFTDTGLTDNTTYSYTVSAYDAAMNNSAQSTPAYSATTSACSISVTKNTYDTSCDGYITYKNTGTGAETNPKVVFTIPSAATLDTSSSACSSNNTLPTGIKFSSCTSVAGTTITYAFTGSLAVGASIALYYSTNNTCAFTSATNVEVIAATCP